MPDSQFLAAGAFVDSDSPGVAAFARRAVGGAIEPLGAVLRLYTAIRDEILARDPQALPGATSNHCYFCWYVLTRGLAAGVAGGGGQVGGWTGERPNYQGELVQVGIRRRGDS